ncbi:MAG: four helix bundle protein [Patescibacteria group bacterium]
MESKIKTFTDLNTWKEGHRLVLQIYKAVKAFPKTETYALIDQILRAVVSITSNIAEGFGRQGLKEKIQFYYMAQASLSEVQNQLIISKDVGYLSIIEFNNIWDQTIIVHKMLTGLIKSLKKF